MRQRALILYGWLIHGRRFCLSSLSLFNQGGKKCLQGNYTRLLLHIYLHKAFARLLKSLLSIPKGDVTLCEGIQHSSKVDIAAAQLFTSQGKINDAFSITPFSNRA